MLPEQHSPIETIADWSCCASEFYADSPVYAAKIPESLRQSELYQLISNRLMLREFCKRSQIEQPAFVAGIKFDQLSAWAVKRNRFPLAIKSATNGSDCDNCYVLKAFRELPEFYEAITASVKGPVILEEFINAKSRFEITFIAGLPRLITQIGLEKSMRMRHIWRVFPLRPPETLIDQVCAIAGKFRGLVAVRDVPLRFSFVLHNGRPVLIALNAGLNRPEYHPDWCQAAGISGIFLPPGSKTGKRICKLLIYYDVGEYSESDLRAVSGSNLVKLATSGKQTIALLSADNSRTLLDDSEKINTFFKHCRDSDYEPPKPTDDDENDR